MFIVKRVATRLSCLNVSRVGLPSLSSTRYISTEDLQRGFTPRGNQEKRFGSGKPVSFQIFDSNKAQLMYLEKPE